MKKVKFNYDILEDIVEDISKSDFLFHSENAKGIWMQDDEERVTNIIIDCEENKWNLKTFTFIDMTPIGKGISIMFIFSNDGGKSSISYQHSFNGVGDMLISTSPFKNMLTFVKCNKDKIALEVVDSAFGFAFEDNIEE